MFNLVPNSRQPIVKLNRKGANSFESTTNPVLDLFTYTSKTFYKDQEEFNNVVDMIVKAKNFDNIMFLKLLTFHRLIDQGNGIKNIYYLCLLILKEEDPLMYETMLNFSYEYAKDILTMGKLSSAFSPIPATEISTIKMPCYNQPNYSKGSKRAKMEAYLHHVKDKLISNDEISLSFEYKFYGNLIFSTFIELLKGSSKYDPMLLKYLAYETGHFNVESELIWEYLKTKVNGCEEFESLVDSDTELKNELALALRNNLKSNKSTGYFTRKNTRKLKKLFNSFVNLSDCLYKGFHSDGTAFGSKEDRDKEVEMIYQVIKKTPTISASKLTNFIRKLRKDNSENMSLRDSLLVEAYDKYIKAIQENTVKAKVKGLDISDRCMDFYLSSNTDDPELESQLSEMCDSINQYLIPCFSEEFTFSDFADKLVLLIDCSGSMGGKPLNTGLLYITILAKIFKVNQVYYFGDRCNLCSLSETDLNGTLCNLIKKVYTRTIGGTNLQCAFDTLEAHSKSNKHVVIITDGDCDPVGGSSSSPFHHVTTPGKYQHLHLNEYTVVNVSQTKMNFPYLGLDPKVCYVTGNNPKTLNGLIKSLIMSASLKIPITPELVLQNSLDMDCLQLPCVPSNPYQITLSNDQKERLFQVIMSNLPPSKNQANTSNMNMDVESVDSDLDDVDDNDNVDNV